MRSRRNAAFTLVELMIVIAIIGVLASIAVPGFRRYQMISKRSEAFTNLRSMVTSQKSYFAEWGSYIDSGPQPWSTTNEVPSQRKRDTAPIKAAFSLLGWVPEGDVFYDYDNCSAAGTAGCVCTCATCFTASAWGDLDDDGGRAAVMYVEPSQSGAWCPSAYFALPPPVDSAGVDIYQTVTIRVGPSSDDF
jgi:prepilin-type N-terminal cleavage/methylation domain-containing protein